MRVSDVMPRSIEDTGATVERFVRPMINHRISVVPVVAGDGRFTGVVPEGHLLWRAETRTRRRRSRGSEWFSSDSPLVAEEALYARVARFNGTDNAQRYTLV